MPFINADLGNAQESEVVPEGVYEVRNHDAEIKQSKGGNDMIVVTTIIESAEYPNAGPIMTYLSLPTDDDEERARLFKVLQMRRFCEVFQIPFEDNGFDTDDIPGSTAEIQVKQEVFQPVLEDGSPDPNKEPMTSNKLILPRLLSGDNEPVEELNEPEPPPPAPPAGRRTATRTAAPAPAPAPATRGQVTPRPGARNAGRR